MRQIFVRLSISIRILLISIGIFSVAAILLVVTINRYMRMEALADARITSQVILDRTLAIHTYFSHQLKPALFPITDAVKPPSYFDPVWMSSTYAVREIQKYFQSMGNQEFYYKECAINARSPENEADTVERAFIDKINANPSLEFESQVRTLDGRPYLVVLRRGESMEAGCMRCHSTPDQAPADLVARYGDQRSFQRRADEVVSAISIRIPLAKAYGNANHFSWMLSLILLSLLAAFFMMQFWSIQSTVCNPIVRIADQMDKVASGLAPLNNPLGTPPGRELRILTQAFNTMSGRLYENQRHLEERIRQRTAELSQANADLKAEAAQRLKVVDELTESEARYRALFSHMLSGFALHEVILNPNGQPMNYRFLEINPAFETLTGLKAEGVVGKCVTEALPGIEKDPADWIGAYGRVALSGQAIRFEQYAAPLKRWFDVSAFSHQKGYFATIFMDITALKELEQQLRESEAKYRSMMEAMPDPAYICSPDRRVSFVNPAMAAILGTDAVGRPCFEAIKGRHTPCLDCMLPEVHAGKRTENESVLEQNQRRYHAVHAPIRHGDGTVSKMTIYRDITEKLAMEQQLRQAQKMEAVATLTGGIAHDFNNILGIILGNTELAMADVPEWNPAHFQLQEIRTASLRGRDVVRQLLSFSRKSKEERKPVLLAPLVKESLKLLRASLPANIGIEPYIENDLAPVLADPAQIHQILMNLCTNAFHAMEKRGGTIQVTLKARALEAPTHTVNGELAAGDYLCLGVADTGVGIPPESLSRIFDPYYTTKGPERGSGLGLAVVLGIVKSHDAAVQVRSAVGEGTAFEIYFHPAKGSVAASEPEPKQMPGGSERILAVDDEPALIQLMEKMLTRLGYAVTACSAAQEALDQVRRNPGGFDLVLSDLTMPRITGDQLALDIHAIRPDLPVVLCTGNAAGPDQSIMQQNGIADWVTKPLRMHELAAVVRRALDKSKRLA
ncbi:MAG: DUF3365 domain-containing protein [Desulfobacteraceae bacterium]|nr:DUF3365 domain-containing protein [Desulfobacteraceae bacterium]